MDIAKYIGLFLLKNNFCYVHGLGNLELKKKAASYDGQSLQPQQYEVQLTPGGSIDDNLANFIATNEQISISKAANGLRDFSIQARAEMQEGKEVVIPSIGKFVEQNGRVHFITDPALQYTPPSIPVLRTSKRAEEEPSFKRQTEEEARGGSSVNWGKIILILLILGLVIAAIVYGVRMMNNRADTGESVAVDTVVTDNAPMTPSLAPPEIVPAADSIVTGSTASPVDASGTYRVVIGNYSNLASAQRRLGRLSANGNQVELMTRDSVSYQIVMPVSGPITDSARVLDSLGRFFGAQRDVRVYR